MTSHSRKTFRQICLTRLDETIEMAFGAAAIAALVKGV